MPRHTGFVSTLTTVFSQTSLNVPSTVPVNVNVSTTSLPDFTSIGRPRSSNSLTTTITSSSSSVSSAASSKKSSKSSVRKAKKLVKMLKKHRDVWWVGVLGSEKNANKVYQNQFMSHEYSCMYL